MHVVVHVFMLRAVGVLVFVNVGVCVRGRTGRARKRLGAGLAV
jgi:hypothetical protein